MPVSLICPTCGTAATFQRPPVATCPNCQAAFPVTLRQPAEASLLRQNAPRPTLLTVGLYVAPGFGAVCLMGVLAAATNARFVSFSINGDAVTGHEFLATAGAGMTVMGVLALAIAYGIWQERSWTRWLILGFWAAVVAMNVGFGWANSGPSGAVSALVAVALFVLLVGWYLFGKENVVEYYRALGREESARPGSVSKGGS
jgi:uncharacterized membrane protein (DUF2068 family)